MDETGEILGALADLGRLYIGVVSIGIRLSAFPSAQRVRPSSLLEIISPARGIRSGRVGGMNRCSSQERL